ncbi:MAG: hypothetical protein M3O34_20890 [Chloroflexota bacterium]|nr:hypothetical protein [Chloroflexota bacterium]
MADAADDLANWLAELRACLARGELDDQGSLAVGGGMLPVGLAARIMLADLDHYEDLTPEQRRDMLVEARYRLLLRDFRQLRDQIG